MTKGVISHTINKANLDRTGSLARNAELSSSIAIRTCRLQQARRDATLLARNALSEALGFAERPGTSHDRYPPNHDADQADEGALP